MEGEIRTIYCRDEVLRPYKENHYILKTKTKFFDYEEDYGANIKTAIRNFGYDYPTYPIPIGWNYYYSNFNYFTSILGHP